GSEPDFRRPVVAVQGEPFNKSATKPAAYDVNGPVTRTDDGVLVLMIASFPERTAPEESIGQAGTLMPCHTGPPVLVGGTESA
ncbi:MAG: hypothetical protein ACC726_05570, partial [Chloroflexota bacterium]